MTQTPGSDFLMTRSFNCGFSLSKRKYRGAAMTVKNKVQCPADTSQISRWELAKISISHSPKWFNHLQCSKFQPLKKFNSIALVSKLQTQVGDMKCQAKNGVLRAVRSPSSKFPPLQVNQKQILALCHSQKSQCTAHSGGSSLGLRGGAPDGIGPVPNSCAPRLDFGPRNLLP